jgi:hypothetical protein
VNPSIRTPKHRSTVPPAGLAPGWPRAGLEGGVTSCAGIPPRRQRRRSRPGAGVHVVQPSGAPHGPLPLARSKQGRRRDGIPTPSCPATAAHLVAPGDLGSCPSRARSHGDSRGITGSDGQKLTHRAREHFPVHTTWQSGPLQGGTPIHSMITLRLLARPGVRQRVLPLRLVSLDDSGACGR